MAARQTTTEAAAEARRTGIPQAADDGREARGVWVPRLAFVLADGTVIYQDANAAGYALAQEVAAARVAKHEAASSTLRAKIRRHVGSAHNVVGFVGEAMIVFAFGYAGMRIGEHFGRHFEGAIAGTSLGVAAGRRFAAKHERRAGKAASPTQATSAPTQAAPQPANAATRAQNRQTTGAAAPTESIVIVGRDRR